MCKMVPYYASRNILSQVDSDHCNWAGMVAITYIIWININCLEHVIDQVEYIASYQFEDISWSSARDPGELPSCSSQEDSHIAAAFLDGLHQWLCHQVLKDASVLDAFI